ALVTSHIPLSQVASGITLDRVIDTIHRFNQSLHNDFSIDEPRIALLGLNPHAGDGGVLGQEENLVIQPAIDSTRAKGIHVSGPFAADALFGNRKEREFDGILAMYHDQGLIPFKTLSFGSGVNYTAGLPIIRTSPDHGTAFDIAGQGTALESSFTSALELAWKLVKSRRELL
ncbi:MAG: 4-hydroxythreonine-4-phosphate dehydrogenase PdxA, partial [Balneolaceae bacterium]